MIKQDLLEEIKEAIYLARTASSYTTVHNNKLHSLFVKLYKSIILHYKHSGNIYTEGFLRRLLDRNYESRVYIDQLTILAGFVTNYPEPENSLSTKFNGLGMQLIDVKNIHTGEVVFTGFIDNFRIVEDDRKGR